MPAATPAKRVLADTTRNKANVQASPRSVKKPKLEHNVYQKPSVKSAAHGSFGSSQPKSQFEEDVLVKMSQDIEFNKQNSTERDQQWARPPLDDFNELDNLCFQQIDAEEGVLSGGKATVKLFGVTQVSCYSTQCSFCLASHKPCIPENRSLTRDTPDRPLSPPPRHTLSALLLHRCARKLRQRRLRPF
jgi:hypothetical protein